ncbi:hypothetical protein MAPG_08311, partial [Magnaporthiopsis poae ATCC 64411]|uniref:Uncharacterized protein n=1 Tax=Magnaporthiopsis poae (strain ATCC 64411 / 73-15) TaxID=644358 RepID=A0A0C4E712_MAGP6
RASAACPGCAFFARRRVRHGGPVREHDGGTKRTRCRWTTTAPPRPRAPRRPTTSTWPMHNDDPEDVTDDEDWAAVGAAALRAASYSNQSNNQNFQNAVVGSAPHASAASRVYNGAGGVGAGLRTGSYNAGMARAPQPPRGFDFAAMGATASDAQEREAVEALLSLGSL